MVIHSGSRNLGKIICEHYQKIAINSLPTINVNEIISRLRAEGREKEIEKELKKLPKRQFSSFEKETASIHGINRQFYLNDMEVAQEYASLNRRIMAKRICDFLGIEITSENSFETIHNYIDIKEGYIRKGAVSARRGEKLIIPLNMRDGSLVCVGKGNEDWNYSAPHGAGRLMSRREAKDSIKIEDFIQSMEEVYSTTISESTLDESPMAYKPAKDIMGAIGDTVEIIEQIKPIYNRKG